MIKEMISNDTPVTEKENHLYNIFWLCIIFSIILYNNSNYSAFRAIFSAFREKILKNQVKSIILKI